MTFPHPPPPPVPFDVYVRHEDGGDENGDVRVAPITVNTTDTRYGLTADLPSAAGTQTEGVATRLAKGYVRACVLNNGLPTE